jgi:hypothetical protein
MFLENANCVKENSRRINVMISESIKRKDSIVHSFEDDNADEDDHD